MPLRVAINGFGRIGRMLLKAAYSGMVKVMAWYDNETGFSYGLLDLLNLIASKQ